MTASHILDSTALEQIELRNYCGNGWASSAVKRIDLNSDVSLLVINAPTDTNLGDDPKFARLGHNSARVEAETIGYPKFATVEYDLVVMWPASSDFDHGPRLISLAGREMPSRSKREAMGSSTC